MSKLVKLLPTMAIALGITAVTVQAGIAKFSASATQEQEWELESPNSNPTQADSYVAAPSGTRDDCANEEEEICVIVAPADSEGKPDFAAVSGLQDALNTGASHPNISRGPMETR